MLHTLGSHAAVQNRRQPQEGPKDRYTLTIYPYINLHEVKAVTYLTLTWWVIFQYGSRCQSHACMAPDVTDIGAYIDKMHKKDSCVLNVDAHPEPFAF